MLRSVVVATLISAALTACSGGDADPRPAGSPTVAGASDGATPTDPGTALAHGDTATLVWHPTTGITGMLEATVTSVKERRQSVFDGWLRDDTMEQARPYFVTVSLTNVGESDLAGQAVPLYLRDDRDRLGAPWTLGGDFTRCQSGPLPSPFEAGATTEMCLVFLAPGGARIEDMVFEPTEGYDPITWTGEVDPPARDRKRASR